MPNDSRRKLIEDLASEEDTAVVRGMSKRSAVLEKKKSTGGMFDFIFKKRMERQKQMKDIYGEM